MQSIRAVILCIVVCCVSGCGIATAVADSKQAPLVSTYTSKKPADALFTAAVQAMGGFGKLTTQDRASGLVQGEKGNWLLSVNIAAANPGSRLQVSARYVPSNKLDFNSREDLTRQLIGAIESNSGDKLVATVPQ